MWGLPGLGQEIVQILERIAIDIYCLQENSFGGKSVRMIGGKTAECKLLWIGNWISSGGVGMFVQRTG